MTVLSAQSIRERVIFTPFHERTRCALTGMTHGLSAAGYDVRIAESIVIAGSHVAAIESLMHASRLPREVLDAIGESVSVKSGFTLASTLEHFSVPDDCIAFVHDKSTLARQGIAVQNTVIEPGWRGHLTLEITAHGDLPVFLPKGSPIAQVVFHLLDRPTTQPYDGRYQDQEAGPQEARFLD